MNAVFLPAIRLLDRLGFRAKFIVIFLSVMTPLGVLSFFVLSGVNDDIHFLENESRGVQFIVAAKDTLREMQAFRQQRMLQTNDLSSTQNSSGTRIADLLTQVRDYASALGAAPATLQALQDVQSQWRDSSTNSTSAMETLSSTIDSMVRATRAAATDFELTLSSHADTYFLSTALIEEIPAIVEASHRIMILGSLPANRGFIEAGERVALEVEIYRLQSATLALREGISQAQQSDNESLQPLSSPLNLLIDASTNLQQLIQSQVLAAADLTGVAQTIIDASRTTVSAGNGLYDSITPQLRDRINERLRSAQTIRAIDIAMIVSALLILCYMFSSLYLAIHKSVDAIVDMTGSLSRGELGARVKVQSQDELGDIGNGINSVAERFESLTKQILSATMQLAAAAEELSSVSRHSADNVLQQRAETDMVAVSINEMNATVQEVSQSTIRASQAAMDADEQAALGADVAQKTARSIQALSEDINHSAQGIQRVAADSQAISSILDVIMGVAEQTNLLALNAAIEAARAGDHGRGFAVVADEVRTLANRTLNSASEIDAMIRSLQTGVQAAVSDMEKSQERAKAGVSMANKATDALDTIMQSVSTIKDMNLMIASASEQQSATTEELNRNVTSIRDLAEQSAAGASQTTSASDELAQLASNLQNEVRWFKVSA